MRYNQRVVEEDKRENEIYGGSQREKEEENKRR